MWIDQRGAEVVGRPECLRLLAVSAARRAVGRLAVSGAGAPLLQPANFAYADGRVFLRVGDGLLWRLAAGRLVAFEVDGAEPEAAVPFAWSVVVRGLATSSAPELLPPHVVLEPAVPSPGDRLLAVRPDVVSGRRFALRPPGAAEEQKGDVVGARHVG